jgi:hypothetical protein
VNAPDLFIPLMGLWSYALMSCIVLAFKHTFKPELMSSTVSKQLYLHVEHTALHAGVCAVPYHPGSRCGVAA